MKSGGDSMTRVPDGMTRVPTADGGRNPIHAVPDGMTRVPTADGGRNPIHAVPDGMTRAPAFSRQGVLGFWPVENGFTPQGVLGFKGRVPVEVGKGRGPVLASGDLKDKVPRVDPVVVGGGLTLGLIMRVLTNRAAAGAAAVFSLVPVDVIENPTGVQTLYREDI